MEMRKCSVGKSQWMRLPSTACCCPTHAIICAILISEPFDPEITIFIIRFEELRCLRATLPVSVVTLLNTLLTDFKFFFHCFS